MENLYGKDPEIEKQLAERIFLKELKECERFPKYLMIEPINACNARCIMCYYGAASGGIYRDRGEIISDELFNAIVKQMEPHAEWIEMVTMYGRGEPLLDMGLEAKISRLKDIGIKHIQLSTNAELLNGRTKELLESGVNDLRFSVDSVYKDRYEHIRKGLSFEKVIENIEEAINIRNSFYPDVPIRVRGVALEQNADEREEWMQFWKQRLRDSDKAEFIGYHPLHGEKDGGEDWPCISVFSTMVIHSNGNVVLCCNDWEGNVCIGNVSSQSLIEIWRSEKLANIRRLHITG